MLIIFRRLQINSPMLELVQLIKTCGDYPAFYILRLLQNINYVAKVLAIKTFRTNISLIATSFSFFKHVNRPNISVYYREVEYNVTRFLQLHWSNLYVNQ